MFVGSKNIFLLSIARSKLKTIFKMVGKIVNGSLTLLFDAVDNL